MSLAMKQLNLQPPWLINNQDLIACTIYQAITCKEWPTLVYAMLDADSEDLFWMHLRSGVEA